MQDGLLMWAHAIDVAQRLRHHRHDGHKDAADQHRRDKHLQQRESALGLAALHWRLPVMTCTPASTGSSAAAAGSGFSPAEYNCVTCARAVRGSNANWR